MSLILQILFWISILAILHSYLFYPFLLKQLAKNKKNNTVVYKNDQENWPAVAVIMSLYNEEAVIERKLRALQALDYPADQLSLYIGSDCSSDATNAIVTAFAEKDPRIHFFPFTQRRGKPGVVNELAEQALRALEGQPNAVFVITDANVMPKASAFRHLMKHFKNPDIVVVDSNMVHTGMEEEGISRSEDQYISGEVQLKHLEGKVWGKMIGPFGGCYAIRAQAFTPVPPNYLVDDFFITLKVLEKGGHAINDLNAVCFEAVSHEIQEEYRRKSRISAGNFQNMATFLHLWWPPTTAVGFAFFSHKILRWLGPIFLLLIFLTSGLLSLMGNPWYLAIFIGIILSTFGVSLLDILLKSIHTNILIFRHIRYFLMMNMALLEGLIKYLKGVKSNVWQPPKRIN